MGGSLERKFIYLQVSLLLVCLSEIKAQGISCFKCTIAPLLGARAETSQICSQFDASAHFQIYCPKSTLCMKRTIHHKLVNGTIVITSVERGCAPQLDTFQSYNFDQRAWQSQENIVKSAYEEGCVMGEDRGAPGGPSEYCYCQYPLCNNAKILNTTNYMINFLTLIFFISIVLVIS